MTEIKEPKQESYQDRVEKMTTRQLRGELKRIKRRQDKPRMNDLLANVLDIMLDSHDRGMVGYIR